MLPGFDGAGEEVDLVFEFLDFDIGIHQRESAHAEQFFVFGGDLLAIGAHDVTAAGTKKFRFVVHGSNLPHWFLMIWQGLETEYRLSRLKGTAVFHLMYIRRVVYGKVIMAFIFL